LMKGDLIKEIKERIWDWLIIIIFSKKKYEN
jgi:hypothetical protein